jgi:ribonucleoside-diphosphate reductase alpha chain
MTSPDDFRTELGKNIFYNKYAFDANDTWSKLCMRMVEDVCGGKQSLLSKDKLEYLIQLTSRKQFIPGGRYLYYAGRPLHAWNNCYLLKGEEDTREEWGLLLKRSSDCLMNGGGIGVDYSIFRSSGAILKRTGGTASGPIPLMHSINEVGRNVMQGGSRRSAIYASLNWQHGDAGAFLKMKDWHSKIIGPDGFSVWDAKQKDFNYPAPLDMTNVSLNYDDDWLNSQERHKHETFVSNVRQALSTGEPGFSFNFGSKCRETLRNACTEVTSEDDSDVCNLGSLNMAAFDSIDDWIEAVGAASEFLVCGTLRADLPYKKIYHVREKNRRLGLGLMGIHEWLLKRGYGYACVDELRDWLEVYRAESERAANNLCRSLGISQPVAYRAIAPTGTIGILAGTTTGIEPVFAVAYKRRYLKYGVVWHYEYALDATAELMIKEYGVNPDKIETAYGMSLDPEKRIKFQADVQDYVDMAISSTINMPAWGSGANNEDGVADFAATLSRYAGRLRGFTCYPDGSRGGQPITEVPYSEAIKHKGVVFEENQEAQCRSGICGI